MSIRTVLLSIQALLSAAEPDDPQDAVVASQVRQPARRRNTGSTRPTAASMSARPANGLRRLPMVTSYLVCQWLHAVLCLLVPCRSSFFSPRVWPVARGVGSVGGSNGQVWTRPTRPKTAARWRSWPSSASPRPSVAMRCAAMCVPPWPLLTAQNWDMQLAANSLMG